MAGKSQAGFEPEVADAMFAGLEEYLSNAPATCATVSLLAGHRRRLSALECQVLADMKAAGNSDRNNESAARATGASKRVAAAVAKRASAVAQNRSLGDALAEGDIGESELDAIAYASGETGGAGATSEELFEQVKAAGPDKANAVARQWVDEQKAQDEHDARYDRQRRLRKVSRFTTRRGTEALMAEGDAETIHLIEDWLVAKADELFQADGGRNVSVADHPRTYDQRRFDAFAELMSGGGASAPDDGSSSASCSAFSSRDVAFHVISYASDWTDDGPTKAFSLDGRRLPAQLLERLSCKATFLATVFDGEGEVLFHGRKKRLATPAQVRALIARDKGCVQCGANPLRCQAHHLTPFNSPKAGKTNIDEMALMCSSCHQQLHDNNQTLYWTHGPPRRGPTPSASSKDPDSDADTKRCSAMPTRAWKTRPASPDEIAAKRPKSGRAGS